MDEKTNNITKANLSVKALDSSFDIDTGTFEGYATVFNSIDQVGDLIEPKAFDEWLSKGVMPAMFYNHDGYSYPIGKWISIEKDAKGLKVKGQIDLDDYRGKEVYKYMKFGSIAGLSLGFTFSKDDTTVRDDNVRVISKVLSIYEISIVAMPCEQQAVITSVKSIDDISDIRDFERYLRDAGISKSNAVALCSKAKSILNKGVSIENSQGELEKQKQIKDLTSKLNQLNELLTNIKE